jgi:hypothetical protein
MASKSPHDISELTDDEMDRIVETGRESHFRKYLAETDQMLTSALSQRYRDVVPPERIEAMLAMPTQFEGREAFDRALTDAGDVPGAKGKVLGYSRFDAEPAHVAVDQLEIPKTIAHERLHQLSDSGAPARLGTPLYEGITEDLAIDAIGTDSTMHKTDCYPVERAVAHEMRDIAGDAAVERAYFAGDTTELTRRLDERLGPGGLESLQRQIDDLTKDL